MRKKKQETITPQQNQMIFEAIQAHQSGNLDLAEKQYNKLLNILPKNLVLINNLAAISIQKGDFETALERFNKSLNIQPNQPSTWNNQGNVFKHLGQYEDAVASYKKAIKYKSDYMIAYLNCGNVLTDLRKPIEALENYDKGVLFNRESVNEFYGQKGNIYRDLDKYVEYIYGNLLLTKMSVCDWDNFDDIVQTTSDKIKEGKRISSPFPIASFLDDPHTHQIATKSYIDHKYRDQENSAINKYPKHKKIRIGYYSADFRNHATSYLMANLFEMHDKSKFEIIAFSFGPPIQDEMQQRVASSFDKFFDVSAKTDAEILKISRDLEIDIAIDLKGFTRGMRLELFTHRLAPIQVNYLGYPGTMAADYIDYIIADKTLIPDQYQKFYSEKIAYLPNSYQSNDRKRKISDKVFSKADFNLPEDSFIFCSFNQSYKIVPQVFDCWMDILKSVENSVLWILEENEITINNLKKEASERGVDESRLIFADRMPLDEHLARQKLADLFLDSYPYNAHTTCSDALWVGLPVVTLCGKSFASRVSASLLNAIDVPELITESTEEYKQKALELANNKEKFAQLKEKLAQNRLTTPLFDIKSFTSHIEQLYNKMYDRYHADLSPENIEIDC